LRDNTGQRGEPDDGTSDAVVFDHVCFAFDDHVVLRDVSFQIPRGRTRILLGPSGSGKSVILKLILGLLHADAGTISVNGHRLTGMNEASLMRMRAAVGMVFQENALFDSLTVGENVGYRLYEETSTPHDIVRHRVEEVLAFIGLDASYIDRLPSELSGGQRRRVAIARAMASKPELYLLDDPTSGLDPITATTVDDEIVKLRDLEHVTCVLATHQIRDAFYVASHQARKTNGQAKIASINEDGTQPATFMVLHDARLQFEGSAAELHQAAHPYLQQFMARTLPPW
jgi:phospholipid/cholesterol/gamma-HCH transport system ATP-binding protein